MPMKIGFQTIVWWPFRDSLEYRLEVIAAAGYQGVEFKERPRYQKRKEGEQLPDELVSIDRLRDMLAKYKLELIGLSGGSLKERMDFCGDFRPEYLYIEDWNEEVAELLRQSRQTTAGAFTLALHPHVFKPVHNLKRAEELLKEHAELKFVPDTAHLKIAGDSPVEAIHKWHGRIAAVHLKDWIPDFGRSAHRYARGFIELGEGEVELDEVLKVLKEVGYTGWLVVEQDSTRTDPATNTLVSAQWLADKGLLGQPPKRKHRNPITVVPHQETLAWVHFLEDALAVGWQDIDSCYESVADAILQLCDCHVVTVWTCSPAYELMNLVAMRPPLDIQYQSTLYTRNTVTGDAIEAQTIVHFDLSNPEIVQRFGWPEILKAVNVGTMVALPVFNLWNPNHVRLVVNLFCERDKLLVTDPELFHLAVAIAHCSTSALSEVCYRSAVQVSMRSGKSRSVKVFAGELTRLIEKTLNCTDVAILLTRPLTKELEFTFYNGDVWAGTHPEDFSTVWNTFISRGMLSETVMFARGEPIGTLESRVMSPEDRCACMTTPLLGADGKILGLVYCANKSASRRFGVSANLGFSDDDAAVLEAIAQAAVPHLELLQAQERREKAMGRMTHELKVPLVAMRGAAQFIMRTTRADKPFDHDYPGDIWSWSELMGRLIDNVDAARYSLEKRSEKALLIHILPDVVAPVIKQVRFLLEERGFTRNRIKYKGLDRFPKLYLARNQFQQVIFNLLSNSIKYAYKDPSAFRVEIEGREGDKEFLIFFRDWGSGIEPGTEELVFEEGYRGRKAAETHVSGQGLGLWIVRILVEGHRGSIEISNARFPTEFQISLPYWLTSHPAS